MNCNTTLNTAALIATMGIGAGITVSLAAVHSNRGTALRDAGRVEEAASAYEAALRLAPRFPELQHYIVGRLSDDEYQAQLLLRVREAGLEARVHFLGNIDEDEKIDLLQRAAVFVHTPVTASDGGFEGFGIVYLEASASSTPVIGTLGCGAEDAIVDGETGLLVAQQADAVEAALFRLLEDGALRERMGAAGALHAAASGWEENARKVMALYEEALA